MLNSRSLIACFFILCLICCNQTEKRDGSIDITMVNGNKITICDLSKVSTKEELLLSDLVEDLEIIRLENSDEALLKKVWMTTITDNYIGVRQHSQAPFKLFDRKGNFLRDIGKVGNGPGEYAIALYDEIIDEKNSKIYLTPFLGNKIMVYGLDGNHIKDIPLPFKVQKPRIRLTDEGYLTVVHMPFPDDKAFAFQIDMDGNMLKKIAPREDMQTYGYESEIFSSCNTPEFDIYYTALDTLYHLNAENLELIPVFTSMKREDGWFCTYKELPDRYLLTVFKPRAPENRVINILKGSETSSQVTLMNDYLGNLEVDFSFNKGYFVQNDEPGVLIEKINTHLASAKLTEEDSKKLNALLTELDEDQNNIVMIGKLKEF